MTHKKVFSPAAAAAAAALLLLLATTLSTALPLESIPSSAGVEGSSSGSASSLPEKLGKLKVKVGGSRFLSAGNTVTATRGDIRIKGFDARMRFNSLTLGSVRAAGLKAQKKVQMPFTRGLADISNRAAAAAVNRSAVAAGGDQAPSSSGSDMTPEERRQRILQIFRNILPQIRRRVLLIRLRRRSVIAAQSQPAPSGESPVSPAAAAAGTQEETGKIQKLKQANKQLQRVNGLLLLAVRGLIRKAVQLRRELQQVKQQQQQQQQEQQEQQQDGEGDSETSDASSAGETPEQLKARRAVLLRQYPSPVSPFN
ncbi:hypothetical protein Emed_001851 [Eimeria media]